MHSKTIAIFILIMVRRVHGEKKIVATRGDYYKYKTLGDMSFTLWLTGLSGAGKTTLAETIAPTINQFYKTVILDGDNVRKTMNKDLGFSNSDRDENIRRLACMANILNEQGVVVIVSAITPFNMQRELARSTIKNFKLVYINCPLEVCEQRDVKSLYKMARSNQIQGLTGISSRFDEPVAPDLVLHTDRQTLTESYMSLIRFVQEHLELKHPTNDLYVYRGPADKKQAYQEFADRINQHQSCGYVHPYTCGVDSTHRNLEPRCTTTGEMVLVCPTCLYTQTMDR